MDFGFTPSPDFDYDEFRKQLDEFMAMTSWEQLPLYPCRLVPLKAVDLSPTWSNFISQMAMDGLADAENDEDLTSF